jgi:hypothetical protein
VWSIEDRLLTDIIPPRADDLLGLGPGVGAGATRAATRTMGTMLDAETVQRAFDAAVAGDLDPLVSLFAADLDWSGLERGHLCSSTAAGSSTRPRRRPPWSWPSRRTPLSSGSDGTLVTGGEDRDRFQVLQVRDDGVYEMRAYRTGREAMKAAK